MRKNQRNTAADIGAAVTLIVLSIAIRVMVKSHMDKNMY